MAEPLTPAGVKVQGNIKAVFVPTLSLTDPDLSDLTGPSAIEMTNIFYADSGRYQAENATGAAPRRLGSRKQWQQFGSLNESFSGVLRYTVDPQGATGSDGKKAYEALPDGTTGVLFFAPGLDTDADLAVDDWGYGVPVEVGPQVITGDPADEFAEFAVEQSVIVVAPGAGALVQIVDES